MNEITKGSNLNSMKVMKKKQIKLILKRSSHFNNEIVEREEKLERERKNEF